MNKPPPKPAARSRVVKGKVVANRRRASARKCAKDEKSDSSQSELDESELANDDGIGDAYGKIVVTKVKLENDPLHEPTSGHPPATRKVCSVLFSLNLELWT